MLHPEAVRGLDDRVHRHDEHQIRRREGCDEVGGHEEDTGPPSGEPRLQRAGGDGTAPLDRVSAVRIDVPEVVEQVDARRGEAERDERDGRAHQRLRADCVPSWQQRRKDQKVLRPLLRAGGTNQRRNGTHR